MHGLLGITGMDWERESIDRVFQQVHGAQSRGGALVVHWWCGPNIAFSRTALAADLGPCSLLFRPE